jgi:hypothetical protein
VRHRRLPNVGKSTLYKALTRTAAAQAANYPFCTIEPNTGEVAVPDPRLDKLALIGRSAEIVPTRLTFVDIAAWSAGASKGEGLGNKFLANIREVDAIAARRCAASQDEDIVHVEGRIDPIADAETVETELMLADWTAWTGASGARQEGRGEGQGKRALLPGWSSAGSAGRQAGRLLRTSCAEELPPRRPDAADGKAGPLRRQRGRGDARPQRAYRRVAGWPPSKGAGFVVISRRSRRRSRNAADEQREFLETVGLEEPGSIA